ncbi:MAG: NAD(P)H-hydrate dehydratase [Gemmatimonadota bacterium]|nr:NAD(P)H-hydrate dehydratase [Gemmatimonadota bacterium]
MTEPAPALKLTRLLLDRMPLPELHDDDDKNARGVVFAIGGSERVPGAIRLAGIAALRAGAGKLQIATARRAAIPLAVALPEALVLGLRSSPNGEIAREGNRRAFRAFVTDARAVLVGPGASDAGPLASIIAAIIPQLSETATLVLDGAAVTALATDDELLHVLQGRAIITPHTGEMASLLDIPREEVLASALEVAQECSTRFNCVVVLKGSETFITASNEASLCYRDGRSGLGTSGSGDVLAGIVAGLSARGASPRTAAAWGVWAHGSAGNKLSRSVARIGFLASELLDEIPHAIHGG